MKGGGEGGGGREGGEEGVPHACTCTHIRTSESSLTYPTEETKDLSEGHQT